MWLSACWIFSAMWVHQIFGLCMKLFTQSFSDMDTRCSALLESTSSLVYLRGFIVPVELWGLFLVTFSNFKNWSCTHGGKFVLILPVSRCTFLPRKCSRSGISNSGKSCKHFCWSHLLSRKCVKHQFLMVREVIRNGQGGGSLFPGEQYILLAWTIKL